jgi:hypothetical protein
MSSVLMVSTGLFSQCGSIKDFHCALCFSFRKPAERFADLIGHFAEGGNAADASALIDGVINTLGNHAPRIVLKCCLTTGE